MADSKGTALAFGALGVATLFVVSGMKGVTLSDVLSGKATNKLDPAGGLPAQAKEDPVLSASPVEAANGALSNVEGNTPGLTVKFDGVLVASWIAPILSYGRAHGWKGTVSSGFRTYQKQVELWNSGVKPVAKPGTSNHEGAIYPRGAVDVTDAAGLSAALAGSKYEKVLIWAGSKDPVHFSHPHNGAY